jgi:hypothetical protein
MRSTFPLVLALAWLFGSAQATAADPAITAASVPGSDAAVIPVLVPGPSPAPADDAIAAVRTWWLAFGDGKLDTLEAMSAPDISLTMAAGRTLDRAGLFEQSKAYVGGPGTNFTWLDESARYPDRDTAVVRTRTIEVLSGRPVAFRILSVLRRTSGAWRMVATHTTRETVWSPRVAPDVAGPYASFEGRYRAPKGFVTARATPDGLLMLDPTGRATRFEPIGPGLFETRPDPKANDAVRIAFIRGADGKLQAMLRMSSVFVASFPYAGAEPLQTDAPAKP